MITGEMKSRVDRVWEVFWTGGATNPLTADTIVDPSACACYRPN